MKKTLIFVFVFSLFNMSGLWADSYENNDKQESEVETAAISHQWEFMMAQEEPTSEDLESISSSAKFGKEVAYYYELFKDAYIAKEEVVPGDPTRRTVIRKPDIFNAVMSIEKSLKKAVKKNTLSKEASGEQFCHVLKASLAAIDSETQSLEQVLNENRKNPEALLRIFYNVNVKNIY